MHLQIFDQFLNRSDVNFEKISEKFKRGNYDGSYKRLGSQAVAATLQVFNTSIQTFLPTPSKSHYLFNLRDFSRVIMGCLQIPAAQLDSSEKFIRLWVHESHRVFADRLIDTADQDTFFEIMKDSTQDNFKVSLEKVLSHLSQGARSLEASHIRSLFFGDFGNPNSNIKIYDEITDQAGLKTVMDTYLDEFNQISTAPMKLVMFRFAIEHVSRVCRILSQPGGHALLIGVGGSGRIVEYH